MVISDGIGEEIAGVGRGKAQPDLRAAEVGLVLVAEEFSFGDEGAVQRAGDLEDGDRAFREVPVNAYADAGFEVRVVAEFIYHIEGDGAVGEEHFAGLDVDAGGVGLEAGATGEGLGNHHAQKGWDVAFAAGGDAFGVQQREGVAAGVVDGGQEVEAADSQRSEAAVRDKGFYCIIYLFCSRKCLFNLGGAGKGLFVSRQRACPWPGKRAPVQALPADGFYRPTRLLVKRLEQRIHRDMVQGQAEFSLEGGGVPGAGD